MERLISFNNHVGEKLAGTLHEPNQPTDKGVVLGHCFTCTRHTRILIDIANKLSIKGIMALRFDFSGNGQSEGAFIDSSYSKHIQEMKRASEFLSEIGISQIAFIGHSMGASIAVLAANEIDTIQAVCALAGRLSPQRLDPIRFLTPSQREELEKTGKVHFMSRGRSLVLSEKFFSDAEKYELPKILTHYQKRILIIHGDQDEIISVNDAYTAYQFNPKQIQLEIIPGADHMFTQEHHRYLITEKVVNWLMDRFNNADGSSKIMDKGSK